MCKLNWLFSSFTYLPNFMVWLPSFSSPWPVQLASKCHLAIFALVWFSDFFYSVKKVSKPSISPTFFKAKTFVVLFFLLFVWFISGEGISWFIGGGGGGGNFHRGQFSWGQISGGSTIFSWAIFWRGGGNLLGGNFPGGNFPDTENCTQGFINSILY